MTKARRAVVRKRKPGRPRKYGPGRINATVRFTRERYAALKTAADSQGRSVSEEVEARIEKSFSEDHLAVIHEGVGKAAARITELEKSQTLNEEMIERAVTRALAKARLTINGENS